MPNYIDVLRAELDKLDAHREDLLTTIRVLQKYKNAVHSHPDEESEKPRVHSRKKESRIKFPIGGQTRARKIIMEVFAREHRPMQAREFSPEIQERANCGESTVWLALKQLRDEGQIMWDKNERIYTLATPRIEKAS